MAGLLAWLFKTTGQVRKQAAHPEVTSAEGLARHLDSYFQFSLLLN